MQCLFVNVLVILCALLLLGASAQQTAPAVAAAAQGNVLIASIDFAGEYAYTAEANAAAMLAQMRHVVESAQGGREREEPLSLVVFPEGVLWWWFSREVALASPLTPVHAHYSNGTDVASSGEAVVVPCKQQPHTLLGMLSCLGADLQVAVVATIATKTCNPATDTDIDTSSGNVGGCLLFNTAVAVGAQGQLQATYRKAHVYGSSPQFDPPPPITSGRGGRSTTGVDVSVFTVPGMGTVGLLVCVDLEFLAAPLDGLLAAAETGTDGTRRGLVALAVPASWTNTPPLSWGVLYGRGLSRWLAARGAAQVAVLYANCGHASGCWGAGAYSDGRLLGREAGLAPAPGGAYDGVISVQVDPLPATTSPSLAKAARAAPGLKALDAAPSAPSAGAFNCTIPAYGAARCVRLAGTGQKQASVASSSGLASCSASFSASEAMAEGTAVLVALDVQFGVQETPTPLHLVACSVLTCVPLIGPTESSALSCGSALLPLGRAAVSLQLRLRSSTAAGAGGGAKEWEILPLVGAADGHSLDVGLWDYELQRQAAAVHVAASAASTVTLLAIEQNQ